MTRQGTVLGYCEARKSASSDWWPIDGLLRGSTDGKNIYRTGQLTVARFNKTWVQDQE